MEAQPSFYYFAYGSCMCPVDLQRSLQEKTYPFVVGPALLKGYRLGFYRRSQRRQCGVLDIVRDPDAAVEGVLYCLPSHLSFELDAREEGYTRQMVKVSCHGTLYPQTRTYTVVEKLRQEIAPNDWYSSVVLRGAMTCGVSEQYRWSLFEHMQRLQEANS